MGKTTAEIITKTAAAGESERLLKERPVGTWGLYADKELEKFSGEYPVTPQGYTKKWNAALVATDQIGSMTGTFLQPYRPDKGKEDKDALFFVYPLKTWYHIKHAAYPGRSVPISSGLCSGTSSPDLCRMIGLPEASSGLINAIPEEHRPGLEYAKKTILKIIG